jgi:hypothetical protein
MPFMPLPCARDADSSLRLQDWGPARSRRLVPHMQVEENVDPQLALALHHGHVSRNPGAHPSRIPPHLSVCKSSKDVILLQSNVISCLYNKPQYFLLSPPEYP